MRPFSCLMVIALVAADAYGAETHFSNNTSAAQCYEAAQRGGERQDIEVCTYALEHDALIPLDRAATFSNRGLLHARSGDVTAALADHDQAVAIAPDMASLYINRSNTLVLARRYEEAFQNLEQAIDLEDESLPIAYYNRALLFQRLGDNEAARADAEEAARLAPEQDAYQAFRDAFRESQQDRQATKSRP